MITAVGFVVIVVILDKEWCILWQWIDNATGAHIAVIFVINGALCVPSLAHGMAFFLAIIGVKIALGANATHVVHGGSDGGLDACVKGGCVQRHAAPTADANDANAFRVYVFARGKIVHRRLKILCIYVRRGHITRRAAAFSGEGWIKSEGQKTTLCHRLRIKSRGLFFHGAKRTADGNGRQFTRRLFWHIEICCQRDAVAIVEGHLTVSHLVA